MKVLLDTNIIVTYLTKREDKYSKEIEIIMQKCIDKELDGYVAFHSLSILWYVLRHSPWDERLYSLTLICMAFRIASASKMRILRALKNSGFNDFEDNLQDCCAQQVNADYIVTANVKDYAGHSIVTAITPLELLNHLQDYSTDVDTGSNGSIPHEVHESEDEYQFIRVLSPVPHWHFVSPEFFYSVRAPRCLDAPVA